MNKIKYSTKRTDNGEIIEGYTLLVASGESFIIPSDKEITTADDVKTGNLFEISVLYTDEDFLAYKVDPNTIKYQIEP